MEVIEIPSASHENLQIQILRLEGCAYVFVGRNSLNNLSLAIQTNYVSST